MEIHTYFSVHFERNSLTFIGAKRGLRKILEKMEKFYYQYTLSVHPAGFEIIKS
jgi:hypothetical protein